MGKDRRVPDELRQRRPYVKWSEDLGRAICERVAKGERVHAICREPGMPTAEAVSKWTKSKPAFAAALTWAKRLGRREAQSRWSAETASKAMADEVFQRLCEGDSMTRICADPQMPSQGTIARWRKRFPDFEEMVQLGMRVRAERMADEGWEMALSATPETAYLTHVRLGHLRWLAGVMAPRVFRLKMAEPPQEPEVLTTLIRTFGVKTHPLTGERKVVAYTPNPETMQVECDDAEKGTEGWIEEPPGPPHPGTKWKKIVEEWDD